MTSRAYRTLRKFRLRTTLVIPFVLQIMGAVGVVGFISFQTGRSTVNDLASQPVKDSNGDLLYYEGIVQDITDRKRREDELKRQLKELKIEIDQKKREDEVATLTTSSYFQEVQQEISEVNLDEFWN
ncbi:pas pac sensor protein [Leptolyngbya sp. Heron Island J]|uniref:hypothetical protein n=1 Tax=Leptolyngbya sp. Heron Island J TaxID=1385935 RepID=UPI0003B993A7|nr:hypothetical protein [Leptolyngbya sp. Heron Island J]ESA35888.1 pas pac sensor protein [Leptolyngbya sp. Heron Island J]